MREKALTLKQQPPIALQHLPSVIDGLGDERFGNTLLNFLNLTCGAEHCTLFRFSERGPLEILAVSRDGTDTAHRQFSLFASGSYWRNDAAIATALGEASQLGPNMSLTDIRSMPASDFRNRLYNKTQIRERILLWCDAGDQKIALSILRPEDRGLATERELSELGAISSTLLSLVGKHAEILDNRSRLTLALTSLAEIELTMAQADPKLPRREVEVCSRIVFGMSTAGIALDLGVGEETVMTYRKRAYQRLTIGCQRELLLWYVAQWGIVHAGRRFKPSEFSTSLSPRAN